MSEIKKISEYKENYSSSEESKFQAVEEIEDDIVACGLPNAYTPSYMISKIAQKYGITLSDARTCLKLASAQINTSKENSQSQAPYQQTSYYFAQGYTQATNAKNDGMDSLSSLSNYNRVMFGLK